MLTLWHGLAWFVLVHFPFGLVWFVWWLEWFVWLYAVYSPLFVLRSSSHPHAHIFSVPHMTPTPSYITRHKSEKRTRTWKKETHQEGRDLFTSMMKPSNEAQTKSPTQMLPKDNTVFKYTPGNNGRSDDVVSSKSWLILYFVNQSLLSGIGKLKPSLLDRHHVNLETSCNMTFRELVQEEGECIFFGGWCRYGVDRLTSSPVKMFKV